MKRLISWVIISLSFHAVFAQTEGMALVKGGEYTPLYGVEKDKKILVPSFYLDRTPVTHAEFLQFVEEHPQWRKSQVLRLFADERYLDLWTDDLHFPEELAHSPVNNISWFAAKAYCDCQGKRLPNVDEWEYAAMADEAKKDARSDSLYNVKVLRGYEVPKTYLKKVGQSPKNYWGIYDLHGLVWEWTMDFNSIILTGESRNNGNTDQGMFCASGALGANDLMNYAAFMRYAMRSSLKAKFSVSNLGFRCATDVRVATSMPDLND
ncbi:formylglycine-generating enzyme family protein [Pleomorphovibrio marinus]|uniref:formylglycine-generating enzyme family protein n=1 Tax=Pleomorphovibrio marinus TaxID=2164132 RepID=UPI000E0A89CB|nr:formylglycine-generating enzyme family protein [Pleomorphovibrio marinus]